MIDRTNRRQQQNAGRRRKRRPVHGRSLEHVLNAQRKRARKARGRGERTDR